MTDQFKLTPKQESFIEEYIATGNASEAYRRSYDASNMKPETINRNAKALLDHSKISARLDAIRERATNRATLTLESHLEELAKLRDQALEANQHAAAITAETNRGKAVGLYVERRENLNTNYVARLPAKSGSSGEWLKQHKSTTK